MLLVLTRNGQEIGRLPAGGRLSLPDSTVVMPARAGWSMGEYSLVEAPPPPEPEPPTLEETRALALDALASRRYLAEIGGVTFNGMTILTDRESRNNLTAAYVRALADSDFSARWKIAPGQHVELDATTIIAIGAAVADHVQACFDHEADLAALIVAAEDAAALEAIDITAGWPA